MKNKVHDSIGTDPFHVVIFYHASFPRYLAVKRGHLHYVSCIIHNVINMIIIKKQEVIIYPLILSFSSFFFLFLIFLWHHSKLMKLEVVGERSSKMRGKQTTL